MVVSCICRAQIHDVFTKQKKEFDSSGQQHVPGSFRSAENSLVLVQHECLTVRVKILPCAGTGNCPWIHLWGLGCVTYLPLAAVTPPVHLLRVSVSLEYTLRDSLGCDVSKEITFMG